MSTDYILFIHGVNVRDQDAYVNEAKQMFQKTQDSVKQASVGNSSRTLQPIFLFWGDIAQESTKVLTEGLKSSPKWNKFWF